MTRMIRRREMIMLHDPRAIIARKPITAARLTRINDGARILIRVDLAALDVAQPAIARHIRHLDALRRVGVQHRDEHAAQRGRVDHLVKGGDVRVVDLGDCRAGGVFRFPLRPALQEGVVVPVSALGAGPECAAEDDVEHDDGAAPDVEAAGVVFAWVSVSCVLDLSISKRAYHS